MFLNFIFLIFILFLIKCYRRTQDHIYENRSSSSSKHDRDVDVRRKKDPRTERKKDEQCTKSNVQENKKRKRSMSPAIKVKRFKETVQKDKGNKRNGPIFCICGIQTYEHGMLKCTECRRYSHAECYRTDDISIEHICGGIVLQNPKRKVETQKCKTS